MSRDDWLSTPKLAPAPETLSQSIKHDISSPDTRGVSYTTNLGGTHEGSYSSGLRVPPTVGTPDIDRDTSHHSPTINDAVFPDHSLIPEDTLPPGDPHDISQHEGGILHSQYPPASENISDECDPLIIQEGEGVPPSERPSSMGSPSLPTDWAKFLFNIHSVLLLGIPYRHLTRLESAWRNGLDGWERHVQKQVLEDPPETYVSLIFLVF